MRPDEMITFTLATGRTRMSKVWQSRIWTWREFRDRCSSTERTSETMEEYRRMSREEQGAVKDKGGFVGATLRGQRRLKANVMERTLVTLDLDFARPEVWDDLTLKYDCAALMYSTHKHTPEAPRLRLVIPVDRPMSPAEYEPVCRRIAGDIGIEQLDSTSYETARLMYWPTTSQDGEFYFRSQEGDPLCVDDVLDTYTDWRDMSEWPVAPQEYMRSPVMTPQVREATAKAGDPTEKPGAVGAFCRCYGIREAMEAFLPGTYAPAGQGRYTYTAGNTFGGAICFDDRWLYSFHNTDPAHGQLLNAFDLVRVHLYGLDDRAGDDRPMRERPSFRKMCETAGKDRRVKALMINDRRQRLTASVASDFAGVAEAEAADGDPATGEKEDTAAPLPWEGEIHPDDSWLDDLRGPKGNIEGSRENIRIILNNDPAIGGRIYRDMMWNDTRVAPPGVPWHQSAGRWDNVDNAYLRNYLERVYGIASSDKIRDGLAMSSNDNRRHPLRDYLSALEWDGVPRLDTLLIDYLGADDTALVRSITRIHMAAAVARVMEPGVKYDYCLILQGRQGCGKSSLIRILGGDYYKDGLTTFDGKEGMEQLRGQWLVEIGELSAMRRSDIEQVKQFISSTEDRYRPAFQETTEAFPRQCVFWGTTNQDTFLRDSTGNRRFPFVSVHPDDGRYARELWTRLPRERDQIWAEAVRAYRDGQALYLSGEFSEEMATMQEAHTEGADDPLEGQLDMFLELPLPIGWKSYTLQQRRAYVQYREGMNPLNPPRDVVCPMEFCRECLCIDNPEDRNYKEAARKVAALLRKRGWTRCVSRHCEELYGRQKSYRRPGDTTDPIQGEMQDDGL